MKTQNDKRQVSTQSNCNKAKIITSNVFDKHKAGSIQNNLTKSVEIFLDDTLEQ